MGIFARLYSFVVDLVFPPTDTARVVHEVTAEQWGALLSPLVREDGIIGLLPYRHPLVRSVIIEAKFHRNTRAIALLASALQDYLSSVDEETTELGTNKHVLVPVPLGKKRFKERGYNQIEEVLRAAGIPCSPLLQRVHDTAPQTTLSRKARLKNVEGAFRATSRVKTCHTYIVIDDVVTTGATLTATKVALANAGGTSITLVALAH